jgi:hypothetical protein
MHGRITDIRDDSPPAGMILINGELIRGGTGLFEKPAHPWEPIDRLLQPDDPPPGTEFRLVRGDELWIRALARHDRTQAQASAQGPAAGLPRRHHRPVSCRATLEASSTASIGESLRGN